MVSAIIGILDAIPAIEGLMKAFLDWASAQRMKNLKNNDGTSITKSEANNDQRPIENAIGSPLEGKPSGNAGIDTIDGSDIGMP